MANDIKKSNDDIEKFGTFNEKTFVGVIIATIKKEIYALNLALKLLLRGL